MNSLEEALDDQPKVQEVLAGMQSHFCPVSRESRLIALSIISTALLNNEPGLSAEEVADHAAHYVRALQRIA